MTLVKFDISTSLDGYIAGPDPDLEQPLGAGGEQLHEWGVKLSTGGSSTGWRGARSTPTTRSWRSRSTGSAPTSWAVACSAGRRVLGDEPWSGWWGEVPPFHAPVFVVTHHARPPLPREGGTTFHFVTEGVEAAVAQAQQAAGGGRAALRRRQHPAGAPGRPSRRVPAPRRAGPPRRRDALFAGLGPDDVQVETVRAVESPSVTHLSTASRGEPGAAEGGTEVFTQTHHPVRCEGRWVRRAPTSEGGTPEPPPWYQCVARALLHPAG